MVPWDDDSNAHRLFWAGGLCLLVAMAWDGRLRWLALGMFALSLLGLVANLYAKINRLHNALTKDAKRTRRELAELITHPNREQV